MRTPIVKEISALSAHRREVELVRWSLLTVPEPDGWTDGPIRRGYAATGATPASQRSTAREHLRPSAIAVTTSD
jgi:hypothetical protein